MFSIWKNLLAKSRKDLFVMISRCIPMTKVHFPHNKNKKQIHYKTEVFSKDFELRIIYFSLFSRDVSIFGATGTIRPLPRIRHWIVPYSSLFWNFTFSRDNSGCDPRAG